MILELMFFLYLNFILWHEVWLIVVCSTMFCWQMHELTMKLALQKSQNAELRSQFEGQWYIFHLSLSLAMGIFFFLNVKPALYMFLLMASEECFWLAMTGRSNGLICPQKSVDILILNFFSFWMRNYIMYVLLDYMENMCIPLEKEKMQYVVITCIFIRATDLEGNKQ